MVLISGVLNTSNNDNHEYNNDVNYINKLIIISSRSPREAKIIIELAAKVKTFSLLLLALAQTL